MGVGSTTATVTATPFARVRVTSPGLLFCAYEAGGALEFGEAAGAVVVDEARGDEGVASLPEPAGLGAIGLAAAGLVGRFRRWRVPTGRVTSSNRDR